MTAFHLIWFLFMLGLGGWSAKVMYTVGGFWPALGGFVLGFSFIPLVFFVHKKYRRWVYRGDKFMPACSCGSSKFMFEQVGSEYHLLCQGCKTRYEKHRGEVSVYDNGIKKPYKRLVKHQGWV